MDIKKYRQHDVKHWQNIMSYLKSTQRAYYNSFDNIVKIYSQIPQNAPFNFNLYPGVNKAVGMELNKLAVGISTNIINGVDNEWMLSNAKNDMVLGSKLKGKALPKALEAKWMGRNLDALSIFKQDKIKGMGLSDRVWQTVYQQKGIIEQHLALGIKDGTPATKMAGEMKLYLNEPDRLFRRVRDAEGKLQLSRAASEYHPGRGVYRSSYKNALRMVRTETNKAYQHADSERWKKQDFVLGVRVQRSNAPYECEICEAGVGDYPKGYAWDLFHPNCRCVATPLLASDEDFEKSIVAGFRGEEPHFTGYVEDVPESFKDYVKEHPKYEHTGH